jgi:hypothetical protein
MFYLPGVCMPMGQTHRTTYSYLFASYGSWKGLVQGITLMQGVGSICPPCKPHLRLVFHEAVCVVALAQGGKENLLKETRFDLQDHLELLNMGAAMFCPNIRTRWMFFGTVEGISWQG